MEGLKAKPVIDILPVVRDLEAVDALNRRFEAAGYECMGEFGIKGRRYYRKGGEERTHQIHIFAAANGKEIRRHLAFRDCSEEAILKSAGNTEHSRKRWRQRIPTISGRTATERKPL